VAIAVALMVYGAGNSAAQELDFTWINGSATWQTPANWTTNLYNMFDTNASTEVGCEPTNGVVDPGETVKVQFALRNVGTVDATNVVAALLESADPGIPRRVFVYSAAEIKFGRNSQKNDVVLRFLPDFANDERTNVNRTPGLHRMPLLGWLFKTTGSTRPRQSC
jgi:hypothetical protein